MSLEHADADIRYLLDRGYPPGGAVAFVCNHYRLNDEARFLLSRAVISRSVAEKRRGKFLPCGAIKGNKILIDGYNIVIGMESVLNKEAFLCDDDVIRDIKGIFRNFKASENTQEAVELILQFLKENNPDYVSFILDSQISKSGLFAKMLKERIQDFGLIGEAKTSKHVDYDLKRSKDIVASSDGVIIDAAEKVVNFLSCLVSGYPHLGASVARISDFSGQIS